MKKLSLFSFAFNQTVGAGFLSIPFVFQAAGMVYSQILLIFLCYMTYYVGTLAVEILFKDTNDLSAPLTSDNKVKTYIDLMGKRNSYVIAFLFFLACLGVIIGFSSIFASSFASNVPLPYLEVCDIYKTSGCLTNYRIYLTIFILIIYFLAVIGVENQETFQVVMTVLRLLLVIILIGVSIQRMISGMPLAEFSIINLSNFEVSFTVILSSVVFQHAIPSIAVVCKESIGDIPALISVVCCVVHSMVGVLVSLSFPGVHQQCNLSFGYLSGWFGSILAYFVVLLPAIGVIASGPVIIILTTDNTMSLFSKKSKQTEFFIKTAFTFLGYIIAFYVFDLVIALDVAGIILILIVFIYVPLIHLQLKKEGEPLSKYDSTAFHWLKSYFFITLNSVYLLYRVYDIIASLVS